MPAEVKMGSHLSLKGLQSTSQDCGIRLKESSLAMKLPGNLLFFLYPQEPCIKFAEGVLVHMIIT